MPLYLEKGLPGGSVVKYLPVNPEEAGDVGAVLGSGRFPVRGNGNPLQYACLENPMDRGAWWAAVHRVAKSQVFRKKHVFRKNSTSVEALSYLISISIPRSLSSPIILYHALPALATLT